MNFYLTDFNELHSHRLNSTFVLKLKNKNECFEKNSKVVVSLL